MLEPVVSSLPILSLEALWLTVAWSSFWLVCGKSPLEIPLVPSLCLHMVVSGLVSPSWSQLRQDNLSVSSQPTEPMMLNSTMLSVFTLSDGGSLPLCSCCAHSNPLSHFSHYSSSWISHSCCSLLHDSNKPMLVVWMSALTRPVVFSVSSQHLSLGTMPWQVSQKILTGVFSR